MSDTAWVTRSFDTPHIGLRCGCGWEGTDADIDDWDVQHERDRVVRVCPGCGRSVPEWGTLPSVEGAARIARGPLREALDDAGVS